MKRKLTWMAGPNSDDVRKDFSTAQLAAIGAVAMIYNQAEYYIDDMVSVGLTGNHDPALYKRINGVDGKIELIKISALRMNCPENVIKAIGHTTGGAGFSLLKKYRDAVVHCKIYDAKEGVGHLFERRGIESEVLLTETALNGLAERLDILRLELEALANIFHLQCNSFDDGLIGRDNAQLVQEELTRHQLRLNKRMSLPPLPDFPSEPELRYAQAVMRDDEGAVMMIASVEQNRRS